LKEYIYIKKMKKKNLKDILNEPVEYPAEHEEQVSEATAEAFPAGQLWQYDAAALVA
jgi:hypothetical protein